MPITREFGYLNFDQLSSEFKPLWNPSWKKIKFTQTALNCCWQSKCWGRGINSDQVSLDLNNVKNLWERDWCFYYLLRVRQRVPEELMTIPALNAHYNPLHFITMDFNSFWPWSYDIPCCCTHFQYEGFRLCFGFSLHSSILYSCSTFLLYSFSPFFTVSRWPFKRADLQ